MALDQVMVDLETLHTVASGVIMSIGAVRFDLNSEAIDNDGFYASISIQSNLDAGRQISEDTVIWWMQQSPAAQLVFTEKKTSLEDALVSFTEWFGTSKNAERQNIWSNGADFDLPMLAHAYHLYGMTVPWKFWNARCARTYKNLPVAATLPKPEPTVKHNAMSDALAQAKHMQAIQKAMKT
jgi:DNA polymerase III epsilon subunit-like protein